MSMTWRELGEVIDRMDSDEADGEVHLKLNAEGSLQPVNDIKVAEKSLNDQEPSVVFLTL